MQKRGFSDMPLHGGKVPFWLADRMKQLGTAITEAIVAEYGEKAFLDKLSDPLWFQSFGCVLGMDWHSSGITTSVMGALKKGLNPIAHDLGIYICGGRGKHSLQTPDELTKLAERTGQNPDTLVRHSKLTAKIDNTAIQDGYQLYLHNFVITKSGHWAVIQQGMNQTNGMARRYHWNSSTLNSFLKEPHAAVCGQNHGELLNLTAIGAEKTQHGILDISHDTALSTTEIRKILMPKRHYVAESDVNMKRLGGVLTLCKEQETKTFEDLLLLQGLGPRTLQSLTLVSEVIHGTPSRFEDPARFSFAHGGKDGHPFPVPLKVYDETISTLRQAVDKSKIGYSDKGKAMKSLHRFAKDYENSFQPGKGSLKKLIAHERQQSYKYGGRTVFGKAKRPGEQQLSLF
ncbi:DUF763 domain-containing protein [Fulvivirga sp. RKSG066]|uniref:DUF763 domain-containing protein n=1 Tax=Fulvivirga aurantia TaxID=2529383 RepID=UPI0012BCF03C|nr:DUF763 domain-containing protein [Fulvivirga aurantia]MTI19620.1 DUF763 domain-containing protein [Fulvivirga aurantia]